jgi:hypothetical protein
MATVKRIARIAERFTSLKASCLRHITKNPLRDANIAQRVSGI